MSRRNDILAKAMRCIDEIYPASDEVNTEFFPADHFADEAARWIIKSVPLHALGPGTSITDSVKPDDGVGTIVLPADFIRLISFKAADWARSVTSPVYDTDTVYAQQANRHLRGSAFRPVVALCKGESVLEFYTVPEYVENEDYELRYMSFTTLGDDYPARLDDITAWKIAELVLSSMASTEFASICTGKITELMAAL